MLSPILCHSELARKAFQCLRECKESCLDHEIIIPCSLRLLQRVQKENRRLSELILEFSQASKSILLKIVELKRQF